MEAHAKSLAFVSNEAKIRIPYFQRGYVWDESNWEDLLSELLSFGRNHFLGSVILKQQKPISGEPKEVLVVDGQQRLTTLSILVKSIFDTFEANLKDNAKSSLQDFLFYKKYRTDKNHVIKIHHSKIDASAFKKVIESDDGLNIDLITKESSKILQCYKYFKTELMKHGLDTREQLFNSLLDLENKILVVIDLVETDNEQAIFDTINSAGVRLSSADIIKNSLFQRVQEILGSIDDAADLYDSTWRSTFLNDEETVKFWDSEKSTGRSMRDNIEILLHSVAVINGFYDPDKHTLANLGDVYKAKIAKLSTPEQIKEFTKDVCDFATIYRENLASFDSSSLLSYDENLSRLLHILDVLQITTFHPFILHILKTIDDQDRQNKIFHQLERFVVRRMVAGETFKNFNKVCKDIIDNRNNLSDKMDEISDDQIRSGIRDIANKPAAILLFWIELYRRHIDKKNDERALKYTYSLEHILPQKWETHWPLPGKYDKAFETQKRVRAVYSIGNMTLLTTSLNSALRNYDFARKINGEKRKNGIKAYASLSITKNDIVAPFENENLMWDEESIQNRTNQLESVILTLW